MDQQLTRHPMNRVLPPQTAADVDFDLAEAQPTRELP